MARAGHHSQWWDSVESARGLRVSFPRTAFAEPDSFYFRIVRPLRLDIPIVNCENQTMRLTNELLRTNTTTLGTEYRTLRK